MQIDSYLSSCTKPKTKLIKDLNTKTDTLNLIEEKAGSSLELVGIEDHFLNRMPIPQALRVTLWDFMKLKSFYKAKDTVTRTVYRMKKDFHQLHI